MKRLLVALTALLGLFLTLVAGPALGAQEQQGAQEGAVAVPPAAVVHRVDATASPVEASVFVTDYSNVDATVSESGSQATVTGVQRASVAGQDLEIVFVVDTSQRTAQGDVFANVTSGLASEIRNLPAGTTVTVIAAGNTASVAAGPTQNLAAAAEAASGLTLSENAAILNGIARAGDLLEAGPDTYSTVVVFAAGPDTASGVSPGVARVGLVQKGAQLVAISSGGGELSIDETINRVGGVNIQTANPSQISAAVASAAEFGQDRLLVSFEGQTDLDRRGDATLQIGEISTSFSYPGGRLTDRTVALGAREIVDVGGIKFFQSDTGLLIAVGLAFVGIGLAVFSLGLLFASGDTSLQGLLDRYSGEGDGAQLDEDEQALVQTALVKRAVEFSETFAEDRGFLKKVEEVLERANLPLRAGEAMSMFAAIVFLMIGVGFILTGGVLGAIIIGVISAIAVVLGVQFRARRRIRAFEQQLPDALTLLAGTLRAGYSLPQGLEAVSHEIADPMGYELRRVMTEARLGREIEDALGQTAERLSSPDFAWAVMAIGIQREVGGNLNELLMTVADTMIARERLKGEVAALTAEGKMSAIILGGLPPGLGFVMWIMNPDYINVLFTETLGKIFIGLGFVSATIGMAWMKKVITIDV